METEHKCEQKKRMLSQKICHVCAIINQKNDGGKRMLIETQK